MKELYEHNRKALDEIKEYYKTCKRVALIQATGSGKSFVFMKLVHELFPNKKVAYIVPRWAIRDNIMEYADFKEIESNVDFYCYNYFNNKARIREVGEKYDLIAVDEMHHIISEVYGTGVYEACLYAEKCGNYSIGMTGTNEIKNYLGYHDVAEEFFDDNKVYGLSIDEGIQNGLFPQLEYMYALTEEAEDDFKSEIDILGSKITLEETLARNKRNKWLAYFSTIKELEDTQSLLKDLFPDYKLLVIHSDTDDILGTLKEFGKSEGKCVLSSVDMLIEGLHVENTEGLLNFRNINSSRVWWQMIGRLLSIGSKTSPLIIDVCNCLDRVEPIKEKILRYESPSSKPGLKYSKRDIFITTISSIEQDNLLSIMRNKINIANSRQSGYYNNVFYNSKKECCDKLGISYSDFRCFVKLIGTRKEYTFHDLFVEYLKSGRKERVELQLATGKSIEELNRQEYRGLSWVSYSDLSKQLGCSVAYISLLMQEHTIEEVIDHILGSKEVKEYRGYSWCRKSELSQLLGFNEGYVHRKMRELGITEKGVIDLVLDTKYAPVNVYRGIEWRDRRNLSINLNKTKSYISGILGRYKERDEKYVIDYVLEKELPVDNLYEKLPTDYKGKNKYESLMEYFELCPEFLGEYIKDGKLLKQIETICPICGAELTSTGKCPNPMCK